MVKDAAELVGDSPAHQDRRPSVSRDHLREEEEEEFEGVIEANFEDVFALGYIPLERSVYIFVCLSVSLAVYLSMSLSRSRREED